MDTKYCAKCNDVTYIKEKKKDDGRIVKVCSVCEEVYTS
jgi:formylmethanofuran dehydrogenase subunit E